MLMKARERWHCNNPACGCQVMVEIGGEVEGHSPRCACGGIMKKKYRSPVFSYLDFLRSDESATAPGSSAAPIAVVEPAGAHSARGR